MTTRSLKGLLVVTMLTLVPLAACDSAGPEETDQGIQDASQDEGAPPNDPGTTDAPVDIQADEGIAVDDGSADIQFTDLMQDTTPPEVVKTVPADGETGVAVPFTISVTFSEPMRFKETVDSNTFMVRDVNDKPLKGTYSYDDETYTVTWTPDEGTVLMRAAPYKVTLKSIIQDAAGNGLPDWYHFRFSTELPSNMDTYGDIAAKYSPIVYQATRSGSPRFDYLTSFDFDGDWTAANNYDSLKKVSSVPSWIYYDVVETKSHYFIRYVYFYPIRFGVQPGKDGFENDVSGATVVVRKYPTEKPVAVETFFQAAGQDEIRSYVTEESGIVGDEGKEYYGVNWVFPEATLFPAGHYRAYLTQSTHQSCLWDHTTKETPLDTKCELNEGIKSNLTTVRYVYEDGTAQAIEKGDGGFPATLDGISYGLKAVLGELWTKRDLVGEGGVFSDRFDYEPPTGRPGKGLSIPNAFIDTMENEFSYNGYAPWAWAWTATPLIPNFYTYDLPKGSFFLDPAYFFAKKHRIQILWNPDTKMGYSGEYCFNYYLLLDNRDLDPDCSPTK